MGAARLCCLVNFLTVVTEASSISQKRYDAIILGTGLKESLLAGLLASQGRTVLQLEASSSLGGSSKSLNLKQLVEVIDGPDAKLPSEQRIGKPSEYCVERAPKARELTSHSRDAQLLVPCKPTHTPMYLDMPLFTADVSCEREPTTAAGAEWGVAAHESTWV